MESENNNDGKSHLNLQQLGILQVFKSLSLQERREMIPILLDGSLLFECNHYNKLNDIQQKFYIFIKDHIPNIEKYEVFNMVYNRWLFIAEHSIGDQIISVCEMGDVYLYSEKFNCDDNHYKYPEYLFEHDESRSYFFQREIPSIAKFELIYLVYYNEITYEPDNILLKDIILLPVDEFKNKLTIYRYPGELYKGD